MKLKKLLKDIENIEIKGPKDVSITGICADSKCVAPGNLFIAKKGKTFDGADFINQAVDSGALAILTDIHDPFLKNISQIIHKDISKIEAQIIDNYYQNPSKELCVVGVTGTNGKTTTTYLIKHILDYLKKSCGLLGTIEYIFGKNKIFSSLTTPDNILIMKYLKEMVKEKMEYVAIEVSSHGLFQERVKNIDFDAAIFTNLSQDHLDYHNCFENYLLSKKKLFDSLKENSFAIVNKDSSFSSSIIKDTKAKVFSFGRNADLSFENIKTSIEGIEFDIIYKEFKERIKSSLIGRFNIYNLLSAISFFLVRKFSIKDIKKAIYTFKGVKGRLEKVKNKKGINIFIDFAHTEDGLMEVLLSLKEIKKGKIITVFGCGGDRDKSKREKMGKVASQLSDFFIITSDNPRSEDPKEIINQIEKGALKDNYEKEKDRYLAIKKAIFLAKKDDIVLIAGKGHETYQIFSSQREFFDDKKVALEILKRHF